MVGSPWNITCSPSKLKVFSASWSRQKWTKATPRINRHSSGWAMETRCLRRPIEVGTYKNEDQIIKQVDTLWYFNSLLLKMAIYSGFTHWKWWFSKLLLVYQRVVQHSSATKCGPEIGYNQIPWFRTHLHQWLGKFRVYPDIPDTPIWEDMGKGWQGSQIHFISAIKKSVIPPRQSSGHF